MDYRKLYGSSIEHQRFEVALSVAWRQACAGQLAKTLRLGRFGCAGIQLGNGASSAFGRGDIQKDGV